MKEKEDKKKSKFKEYDMFFMQFGFKEDRRIRDRGKLSEETFVQRWDEYIKEDKKTII